MTNMEEFAMSDNRGLGLPLFMAGFGAGIAITLLLAPRNGAATRRLIGRTVNRTAKSGQDWVKDKAEEAEVYLRSRGAELRDRVKAGVEEIARS